MVLSAARYHYLRMAKPSANYSGNPALVSIGKTIRQIRVELNLSQEALANDAGIDRSYMGGVERGEHNLTLISLQKICNSLHISISNLLERAEV